MGDLPADLIEEAERLTRRARDASDDAEAAAYREERDERLANHGYRARVREDDSGAVLVCYPTEWLENGVVRPGRVDDTDRAVERRLSGPGSGTDWESVRAHNDALVDATEADHESVHVSNARALADFASNHYAKPIEKLTREELLEFREEYVPRNAWPSERQRSLLEASIRIVFEKSDATDPLRDSGGADSTDEAR